MANDALPRHVAGTGKAPYSTDNSGRRCAEALAPEFYRPSRTCPLERFEIWVLKYGCIEWRLKDTYIVEHTLRIRVVIQEWNAIHDYLVYT